MKRLLLFQVVAILLSLTATAQKPTEKTLLWEISGKGIKTPSYLFGTIHVMCPGDIKVPQIVSDKFNLVKSLYLEIDLTDPEMMQKAMVHMQMKDSYTIKKLIGSQYDTVNQLFKTYTGIPLDLMNSTKPMMIVSALLPAMIGCSPASWESVYQKMAGERKISIKGLETIEDQMAVFDSIPYADQANFLVKSVIEMDQSKKELANMLKIYNQKDIDQMNILTIMDEDFRKFEDVLLNKRNNKWIPVIEKAAEKEPAFFAFGAGHLGGENGVINLLRQSGFTVNPIMY